MSMAAAAVDAPPAPPALPYRVGHGFDLHRSVWGTFDLEGWQGKQHMLEGLQGKQLNRLRGP